MTPLAGSGSAAPLRGPPWTGRKMAAAVRKGKLATVMLAAQSSVTPRRPSTAPAACNIGRNRLKASTERTNRV